MAQDRSTAPRAGRLRKSDAPARPRRNDGAARAGGGVAQTNGPARPAAGAGDVATGAGAVRFQPMGRDTPGGSRWTFLSNHGHVMLCLVEDPDARVRDMALRVGVTERAVQRILGELEEAGAIARLRVGRRNRYALHLDLPLRHALEAHCTLGDLLGALRYPHGRRPSTR